MEESIRKPLTNSQLLAKARTIPAKPDGGYGWIILLVAFVISFILDGCMYSFGILLEEIRDDFRVTQDIANLVPSLNVGFLFLSGPVSAALAKQFGCRAVVMGGAIVFSLMNLLTAFLPSIYYIIILFGVIGGIAFGCTYLTCFIILVDYFDKKLGIANGITMSGSGLGAFAFAPFTKFLLSYYDWKFTMVILSCIIIQCCVFGALLKPLPKRTPIKSIEMQNLNSKENHLNQSTDEVPSINTPKEHLNWRSKAFAIIFDIYSEVVNFNLLVENKLFLLTTIANFFVFFVYFIVFIFIPRRANEISLKNYAWILSIIGIVNIPFRIIFGFLTKKIPAMYMNVLCIGVATISVFAYYGLINFWMQACFGFFFAFAAAGINSLTTKYLVDIVGEKKFANANGILSMFRGLGCLTGPFIAGYIYKMTRNSFWVFIFAGFSFLIGLILSGIVLFLQFFVKNRTDKGKTDSDL